MEVEICRIMKSFEDKDMEAKGFITCDINAPMREPKNN